MLYVLSPRGRERSKLWLLNSNSPNAHYSKFFLKLRMAESCKSRVLAEHKAVMWAVKAQLRRLQVYQTPLMWSSFTLDTLLPPFLRYVEVHEVTSVPGFDDMVIDKEATDFDTVGPS